MTASGDGANRRQVAADELLWEQGASGATIGPGQWFGEVALLHEVPRTATIRTTSPVMLCELRRNDVREALGLEGHNAARILEELA